MKIQLLAIMFLLVAVACGTPPEEITRHCTPFEELTSVRYQVEDSTVEGKPFYGYVDINFNSSDLLLSTPAGAYTFALDSITSSTTGELTYYLRTFDLKTYVVLSSSENLTEGPIHQFAAAATGLTSFSIFAFEISSDSCI